MPAARDSIEGEENAIERLTEELDNVGQELAGIRQTLDGIREDIAWWLKNNRREQWLPVQPITSMPTDPLASDWAQRINRFTADDLPMTTGGKTPEPPLTLDQTAPDDETHFCCETPDLQWTGDPRFPGIACKNCGYTVADCGSVVMHPAPGADPNPEPKEQQRALFAE